MDQNKFQTNSQNLLETAWIIAGSSPSYSKDLDVPSLQQGKFESWFPNVSTVGVSRWGSTSPKGSFINLNKLLFFSEELSEQAVESDFWLKSLLTEFFENK